MLQDAGVDNAFHRRQLLEYCRKLTVDIAQRQKDAVVRGGRGEGDADGLGGSVRPHDSAFGGDGGWTDWRGLGKRGGDEEVVGKAEFVPARVHSMHPIAVAPKGSATGGLGASSVPLKGAAFEEPARAASVSWQARGITAATAGIGGGATSTHGPTSRMGSVPNLKHPENLQDQQLQRGGSSDARKGDKDADHDTQLLGADGEVQGTQVPGTAEKVVGALKNLTSMAAKVRNCGVGRLEVGRLEMRVQSA